MLLNLYVFRAIACIVSIQTSFFCTLWQKGWWFRNTSSARKYRLTTFFGVLNIICQGKYQQMLLFSRLAQRTANWPVCTCFLSFKFLHTFLTAEHKEILLCSLHIIHPQYLIVFNKCIGCLALFSCYLEANAWQLRDLNNACELFWSRSA